MKDQDWLDLIQAHLERFPDSQPADVFKLIYDTVCGPGRNVSLLPELGAEVLRKRAAALDLSDVQEWEEPVEPLSETGLARVHLRPYLRAGGDLMRLHDAVIQTSQTLDVPPEHFAETIARLRSACKALDFSEVAFGLDDLLNHLSRAARALPEQPPRHSSAFEEAYSPAYCVALVEVLGADTRTRDGS